MKDWKLIFNTKNYHYILIKEMIKERYLNFFWEHQQEIESVNSFLTMMPTPEDIQKNEHEDYVLRFAPMLKPFIEDPNKTTLFIEEDILKTIVKEDKRASFFRYLTKNNKNLVLFHYSDIDKYINKAEFAVLETNEQEIQKQFHILDRFIDIKNTINKTHNPFKDPMNAFHKIQQENQDN